MARWYAVLKKRWERPVILGADLATIVMGYIATVTIGTGFIYLLPTNTFALSPSFTVMRNLGGETFWGILIWTVGILAMVATWLEWHVAELERSGVSTTPPERMPSRRLGRLVWNVVSVMWAFIGCSFFVTVTFSPGAVNYVSLAILAQIIAITARKRRDLGIREG